MSGTSSTAPWRNRITGSGTLKVDEAVANPLNFRLIRPPSRRPWRPRSKASAGCSRSWSTRTTGNLIDGHLRLALAEQRGEAELPCLFVELSEDEERLVLASLDPIAAMAIGRPRQAAGAAGLDRERGRAGARPARGDRPSGAHRAAESQRSGRPRRGARRPEEPVSQLGDLWLLRRPPAALRRFHEARGRRAPDGRRARRADGHRPALSGRLPGRRPSRPARPTKAPRPKTSTGTPTSTTSTRSAFYVDFLRAALDCALTSDAAVYQCFGIMRSEVIWQAWREVGLLPHQVLIWQKSRACSTYIALSCGTTSR